MNSKHTADFYRAFEDRERGSRDLILGRLQVYRPMLQALLLHFDNPQALDLGCGRGEWLQVLAEVGFDGLGIDQDAAMLLGCEELELAAIEGDALAYLQQQPDDSLALVSAFHLVEHLPFTILQAVVEQALRVLQPGGLLIMETPNPENLSVGAHTFYLDPTHERPLPPALLSFLPDYYGFAHSVVWRLQESADVLGSSVPGLTEVLLGVSPDYAVIAQKSGRAPVMSALQSFFTSAPGIGLGQLAQRFDDGVTHLQKEVTTTIAEALSTQDEVQSIKNEMEGLQQQVKMAFAEARFARGDAIKAHDFAIEAESRSKEHAARVEAMVLSTSWRITTPLRSAGRMLKSIKIIRVRHSGKLFLQHSALYIARRPVLKRFFLAVLKQFPNLKNRLAMLRHQQMASNPYTADNAPVERAHLSPRARKIYLDLKSAINKSSEEGH